MSTEKDQPKDVEDKALEEVSGGGFQTTDGDRNKPDRVKQRNDCGGGLEVPVDEIELEKVRGGRGEFGHAGDNKGKRVKERWACGGTDVRPDV